jgi:hypothetical protein
MIPTFIMMSMKTESGATNERRNLPLVLKRGHGLATLNDHLPASVVAGEFPPLHPGRTQHEAKIVNLIVVLAFLDELAVVLGAGLPVVAKSELVEDPHLAAQETFAPVRPGFLAMLPTALVGIDRKVVRLVGNKS